MVQRFVAQTSVPEVVWQPGDGVMAVTAFLRRDEVSGELAGRRRAVMTG